MSIKVTTESFIEKAIEVHGDAYDYSISVYSKAREKLKVRCIKHDLIFEIAPNSHISAKSGCPICRYEKSSEKNRKPKNSFIEDAIKSHGTRFDYSLVDYKSSKTKVKIKCIKHELIFEQSPDGHILGKSSCPLCLKEHRGVSQRDTTETFIKKSKEKFGNTFDYSQVDYVTAKVKVKLRCTKHDLWFETTPDSHLRNPKNGERGVVFGGCPECRREVLGQYHKLSVEDFARRSSEVHDNFYDYSKISEFKNMHENVEIVCPTHGSFFQTPTNHLHNAFGCARCAGIRTGQAIRLSQEEVVDRFKSVHGDRFGYDEVVYDGIYVPVKIWCKTHLNWFYQKPADHFSAVGCKKCVDKGFSTEKPAYFYINKVGDNVALKVGITNVCPIERAKVLDRKSSEYTVKNMFYFYHESGRFILDLENEVLNSFETGVVSKDKMSSGYTETIHTDKLPEIIDIVVSKFSNYKPE